MRFSLPTDVATLGAYVPRFLALGGDKLWAKRWRNLDRDYSRSPMLQKIGADYHWLELLLHDQAATIAKRGRLESPLIVEDFAVLHFVAMVMEVHARLTARGQIALQGRVRSALGAEIGFAALYLEMDVARRLCDAGFDVEFPDLAGTAQHDLMFANAQVSGEVECKSQSADAGRKIHRKDFYRFLETVEGQLLRRAESGTREVLLVTLRDRLPSDSSKQRLLRTALLKMLDGEGECTSEGEYFSIKREGFRSELECARRTDQHAFYDACVKAYGPNIHVAGPMPEPGRCLIVVRSLLEDDTSKPWLEAMKEASSQLSGARPGFVVMQFNDLATDELMSPSLRRRAEILADAISRRPDAVHVAGFFIYPYRGLLQDESGLVAPGFGYFHTEGRFKIVPADYPAFYGTMPDDEFARRIRARL